MAFQTFIAFWEDFPTIWAFAILSHWDSLRPVALSAATVVGGSIQATNRIMILIILQYSIQVSKYGFKDMISYKENVLLKIPSQKTFYPNVMFVDHALPIDFAAPQFF